MSQTNVNIRMDENLKQQFDVFCAEIGLTMTTAFNLFARTVVRQQRIPFELSLNEPNAETRAALKESAGIIASGQGRFDKADDMFRDLGI